MKSSEKTLSEFKEAFLDPSKILRETKHGYPKYSKEGYYAILIDRNKFIKIYNIKEFVPILNFLLEPKNIEIMNCNNLEETDDTLEIQFTFKGTWNNYLIYKEI